VRNLLGFRSRDYVFRAACPAPRAVSTMSLILAAGGFWGPTFLYESVNTVLGVTMRRRRLFNLPERAGEGQVCCPILHSLIHRRNSLAAITSSSGYPVIAHPTRRVARNSLRPAA